MDQTPMSTPTRLQWGILGTGNIARKFASGLAGSATGDLLAVGSRSETTAGEFAETCAVPRVYGSYADLLADPDVQVVYVALLHPWHAEWSIKAAEAGKHVLVEKPIGMNAPEARAMVDAAAKHDVFLMEAFMYRCHPQTAKLVELVTSGTVGDVRMIEARFACSIEFDTAPRAFLQELGGGSILDLGCYATSAVRLIAGAARGKTFAEPLDVKGCGHVGETDVDEWALACLRFPGDIVAQVATGLCLELADTNVVRVFGTEGHLTVPNLWTPAHADLTPGLIIVQRYGEDQPQRIEVPSPCGLYGCEADAVARQITRRQAVEMTWADSVGNMETLDRWRAEIGLVYDLEKRQNSACTITRDTTAELN